MLNQYQSSEYFNIAINFLNDRLYGLSQFLKSNLRLRIDSLPGILKTPLNFSTLVTFMLFIIITFANDLICKIIGILYPILYGFHFINGEPNGPPLDMNKLMILNKYWIVFGSITLIDTFFGFILHWIPCYFYAKFIFIYMLIRNDFSSTTIAFNLLEEIYSKLKDHIKIEKVIEDLNSLENHIINPKA